MPVYTNAQYFNNSNGELNAIRVDINGVTTFVPIEPACPDYANMMMLVAEGQLVIAPAS
jgi:hypothetical protein